MRNKGPINIFFDKIYIKIKIPFLDIFIKINFFCKIEVF
jgi:hypothetical protein